MKKTLLVWTSCWGLIAQAGDAAPELPPVVFVSRALDLPEPASARQEAVELAEFGSLLVREPNGEIRPLVDARAGIPAPDDPEGGFPGPGPERVEAPVDVSDPAVSYDGQHIIFSGYVPAEEGWRLFEIGADGNGLRAITQSDRVADLDRFGPAADGFRNYDDVDPCYLPDGRVCFVSTRQPGYAPDGRVRTTNLYIVELDGSGLERLTSERFGADTPTVEPSTGLIVYSRFWRTAPRADPDAAANAPILPGSPGYELIALEPSTLSLRGVTDDEFPGVNSWFFAAIRPDGTGLEMWTGVRLDRELTQAYRPAFLGSGAALGVFLPVTPYLGFPRGYGLRRFRPGPTAPTSLGGPQVFPRRHSVPPRVNFLYASAEELPDGRLVVTAASALGPKTSNGAPDYAVYLQSNAEVEPDLLYNASETLELDAAPLVPHARPPVLPSIATGKLSDETPQSVEQAFELGGSFRFRCDNIFFNADVDAALVNAPPVGQRLLMEFYMNPQRTSPVGADEPILLRSLEIPPSGVVDVELPAGAPLFEVLRRPDETIGVGRDGQIFHVAGANFGRVGEAGSCVGCHAGHSRLAPENPTWTNLAPSARVTSNARRLFGRLNLDDFAPIHLVDRRTGAPQFEWAAPQETGSALLSLEWTATLRAREVVIYGPRPGNGTVGERTQVIRGATLTTRLDGEVGETIQVRQDLLPDGTRIVLDETAAFDTLTIEIRSDDVAGLYEGRTGSSLAEVEVIAQVTSEPFDAFRRGDTNCDQAVELTDAVLLLNRLFLAPGELCCRRAGDVNADDTLELTDAVFLLSFLFLGAEPPPEPFDTCDRVPQGRVPCAERSCGV